MAIPASSSASAFSAPSSSVSAFRAPSSVQKVCYEVIVSIPVSVDGYYVYFRDSVTVDSLNSTLLEVVKLAIRDMNIDPQLSAFQGDYQTIEASVITEAYPKKEGYSITDAYLKEDSPAVKKIKKALIESLGPMVATVRREYQFELNTPLSALPDDYPRRKLHVIQFSVEPRKDVEDWNKVRNLPFGRHL